MNAVINFYSSIRKIIENLLSSTDGKALVISFDEIEIVASPVEKLKPWGELEQERFAGSIEKIAHVEGTRRQSPKHLSTSLLAIRKW